jgi:competence ComEA-like helix-hairpin-helix protein
MTGLNLSEKSEKEQTRIQSLAFLMSICICAAASTGFVFWNVDAARNGEKVVLDGKVNPNTDTAVSIARLPSLGVKKAEAVVEYRQNGNVFERADDLDKVKGIGPATVESVRPYLRFE